MLRLALWRSFIVATKKVCYLLDRCGYLFVSAATNWPLHCICNLCDDFFCLFVCLLALDLAHCPCKWQVADGTWFSSTHSGSRRMWFSRSGSRRNIKEPPASLEPLSTSKPLLADHQASPTTSSPTKATRTPISPSAGRFEFPQIANTPPTIAQESHALAPVPSRLSASSSVAQGRPSLTIPNSSLLAPPTSRSQRHPSTVNLTEEELDGTDRLFDPLTGKPVAALKTGPATKPEGSHPDVAGNHQTASGDVEDPARQKMWDYLAKIRGLQAEVAAMHLAMDGHALGDPWGARPPMHSRAGSVNYSKDAKPPFMETLSTPKMVDTTSKSPAMTRNSDSDEEQERKERNDKSVEEFVELGRMFERKQEALKGVMAKANNLFFFLISAIADRIQLKELSSVVRAYHELENPNLGSPVRQDVLESRSYILTDSPERKNLPPTSMTPSESAPDTQRPTLRPVLAPILTASPSSSPNSQTHHPKSQAAGFLSPAMAARRTSLEMGAGGGPQGYIPPSPGSGGPPPIPSPPISRASLSGR